MSDSHANGRLLLEVLDEDVLRVIDQLQACRNRRDGTRESGVYAGDRCTWTTSPHIPRLASWPVHEGLPAARAARSLRSGDTTQWQLSANWHSLASDDRGAATFCLTPCDRPHGDLSCTALRPVDRSHRSKATPRSASSRSRVRRVRADSSRSCLSAAAAGRSTVGQRPGCAGTDGC